MTYRGDTIVVKATQNSGQFTPHSEGVHAARCVDVIDLGSRVEQFQDNPARVVPKLALVFASGESRGDGNLATVSTELTASMHEKATLRKFLEAWRGKGYSVEQAEQGVPIHKLCGQPALITVEHRTSKQGRTYAQIRAISPVPKQMSAPEVEGYERAPYWADRIAEYKDAVRKFEALAHHGDDDEPPAPGDEDYTGQPEEEDDLPF